MLVLAIGALSVSYLLLYAGLSKGTNWQHPWQPLTQAFQAAQGTPK